MMRKIVFKGKVVDIWIYRGVRGVLEGGPIVMLGSTKGTGKYAVIRNINSARKRRWIA